MPNEAYRKIGFRDRREDWEVLREDPAVKVIPWLTFIPIPK